MSLSVCIEDLITVASELGRPVIHQAWGTEPHAYYVFDGATRYQYVLETARKLDD